MSDPTPYSRRSPLEHERDEGGMSDDLVLQLRSLAGSHGSTVATPCHAAADRIEALEAENARLREALKNIGTYRLRCREHDADMGHEPRDFDVDDLVIVEDRARAALAKEGEG